MIIDIPDMTLVALVGATSSGKSTFAARHFAPTEVLSSDTFRALVSDDANSLDATRDAFAALHFVAERRLARGRLVVVDATNLQREARAGLVRLARAAHVTPMAVVLDVPLSELKARHAARDDRSFPSRVVRQHHAQFRQSVGSLKREGFRRVVRLDGVEAIDAVEVVRSRRLCDRRDQRGPFDIIGDVHGCFDELVELLAALGWDVSTGGRVTARHPQGRRAVFVGDLTDRGPRNVAVLELVMNMVDDGTAFMVSGNHDDKLRRWMERGRANVAHGLQLTIDELTAAPEAFRERVRAFLESLPTHLVLDGGELVVAHAGLEEAMHGRAGGAVRSFALYGRPTGETTSEGLPIREDWAADYRGRAHVVYGHTVVPEAVWRHRTMCVDQGCVFGGSLSAVRWPERDVVQVPAHAEYVEGGRARFAVELPASDTPQRVDVLDQRNIVTRFGRSVRIGEDSAAAALESMERFAVDPRWVPFLPPSISPCNAAPADVPLLERPDEVLAYYRDYGIARVIAEDKHMGSRAIIALCRTPEAAARRFGDDSGRVGRIVTRTARAFFDDHVEAQVLRRLDDAMQSAGLWSELDTDWVVLDAEILPWSAKAGSLLRDQYAHVGVAGDMHHEALIALLERAEHPDLAEPLARAREAASAHAKYGEAWRRYCWTVATVADLRVAPFHILAAEGRVFDDRDHDWHMAVADGLAAASPFVTATDHRIVDLDDESSCDAVRAWWHERVAAGSEGAVFKPLAWHPKVERSVQPAIKCRGPEYLRIIYGPSYDRPETLVRLKRRGLGRKRRLALDGYALGLEGLHRFVADESLSRVHPCAFGVLALGAEPVDPRL